MDKRRILTLPKQEPWGFVRISEVKVNSRVTGIQMYAPHFPWLEVDCRLPDTEGRFEEI